MPRKIIFVLVLAIILSACVPTSTPQTSEVSETSEVLPATAISAPSLTPEPPQPTETPTPEFPTAILAELGYDAKDHESFAPANYHFETREWMGQQVRMLIHDDPKIDGERIDGMEVTINGETQWVRGVYYPVDGFGGMNVDVLVHPLQERRAFFTNPEGSQDVYEELLTAIAHQLGMSQEGLQNHLATNDNKVTVRLPQFWNPDNHSQNRSPSYLQASPPVIVDLSKPVVYATRSGAIIGQEVAPGVTVPDGIRWVVGDSNAGIAVFVANEQMFVVYESDGNMTSDRAGSISSRLFAAFDVMASMGSGFVDNIGKGQSLLERQVELAGKYYRDGNTIVDREVFWKTNADYSDYLYTLFTLK